MLLSNLALRLYLGIRSTTKACCSVLHHTTILAFCSLHRHSGFFYHSILLATPAFGWRPELPVILQSIRFTTSALHFYTTISCSLTQPCVYCSKILSTTRSYFTTLVLSSSALVTYVVFSRHSVIHLALC